MEGKLTGTLPIVLSACKEISLTKKHYVGKVQKIKSFWTEIKSGKS